MGSEDTEQTVLHYVQPGPPSLPHTGQTAECLFQQTVTCFTDVGMFPVWSHHFIEEFACVA